ncbi:MAG: HEAT repeat domain-containing protein [Bryobacteraceae bacterium]
MRLIDLRLPTLLLILATAAAPLAAQVPEIGAIEFYGLRKVPQERLRRALGVREGERLPPSKGDMEERLEQVEGVVRAHVEAACCEEGKAILYVGIDERGGHHYELRPPPVEDLELPSHILEAYARFLDAFGRAARAGDTEEDLREGHILLSNLACRVEQQRFVGIAELNTEILASVLRRAEDPEHRAIAAYIIGYSPKKRMVIPDLQYAMQDPDPAVRTNAIRALHAVAVLGLSDRSQGIRVTPTWFIELLNSLYWKDRHEAVRALVSFTEDRDRGVLDQLRQRSLHALIEMAGWRSLPHALPAYVVLGRVAGIGEKQILESWAKGEREVVLGPARKLSPR